LRPLEPTHDGQHRPSAAEVVRGSCQYRSGLSAICGPDFCCNEGGIPVGDQRAYAAGIVAILLGAVLVFFMFPKKDEEERLLAEYHSEDTARLPPQGS